ncbi:CoF synthetase [Paenibacillus glacialis]|uniref:CoF synthetase n=1 Tax=Paenibacillus glacialis TaxID=494026 RepID=A0A168N8Q6_9BACL|nr:CoF synthetase [Paenibacillus glacialis]
MVQQLEDLPLLTSTVLEEHYYICDHPFEQRLDLHRYQTSGTSRNLRKNIYYSEQDEDSYIRIKTEVLDVILHNYQAIRALVDMGTGHAAATAEVIFSRLGFEVETVSFQLPIEQHLERLATFRPDVLYTMPSILDRILMAADNPVSYGIRKVILVGEVASLTWQQRVAERLGLEKGDITDTYGSIEIGTIAHYNHELDRYIVVDGIIAEGLTPQELGIHELELADDERVLVLTSTVRDMFPAIRFVTYDVVRDFQPVMVDGQSRQSFRNIVRRVGSELKHGEKISIYDIEDVVFQHVQDASIKVLTSNNLLTIQIINKSVSLDPHILEAVKHDITHRIPEIGIMIQNGLLEEIRVTHVIFDDSQHRNAVKLKRIHNSKEVL